jgi:hypothetical protein
VQPIMYAPRSGIFSKSLKSRCGFESAPAKARGETGA